MLSQIEIFRKQASIFSSMYRNLGQGAEKFNRSFFTQTRSSALTKKNIQGFIVYIFLAAFSRQ